MLDSHVIGRSPSWPLTPRATSNNMRIQHISISRTFESEKDKAKRLNSKAMNCSSGLIENVAVWLFRGLNTPLLFDNNIIGSLLLFFAPHSLQVFTWYSGNETCLESQSSMFESNHGFFFRNEGLFLPLI